jgi:membrane dipeptidase
MDNRFFDAHLDLAYLAECGRDMTKGLGECGGPHLPAAITFPALHEGRVGACLGTIFTEPDGDDAVAYLAGDAQSAHAAGLRQLERYHAWNKAGLVRLLQREPAGLAGVVPPPGGPITVGILMEGADPVRSPDELGWWMERGVIAVGLTWAKASRYAGGNSTGVGLTELGRAMIREIDALGVIHDVSHLSDRALDELFSLTDRPVMASHSNCRVLLDGKSQRHLRDESIAEIGRRGGVIGLNFVRNFIRTGLDRSDPNDRPSIDDAVRHVEHICAIMGHRRGVGLGTDMDGGISAHDLPAGINSPADLPRVTDALRTRGWSEEGIDAFAWGNWSNFLGGQFGRQLGLGPAVGAPERRRPED